MKTYPDELNVFGPNELTLAWIKKTAPQHVAEFGVYRGHTTLEIARLLGPGATLDLFDFEDVAEKVASEARAISSCIVRAHGNSYKIRDSYTWSLKKLLESPNPPRWDYVFLDGAHTWDVDGFAFLLCDLLLAPGGYMDFDDYHWRIADSPSLGSFPLTAECYTEAQTHDKQVAAIVELLVKRKGYTVEQPEKIFRKPR